MPPGRLAVNSIEMDIQQAISFFSQSLPEIFGVGRMVFKSFWSDNLHPSRACELLMPLDTPVTVCYQDGRRYHADCGEVLIIPPKTIHCDRFAPGTKPTLFFCSFQWDKDAQYLSLVNNDTIGSISKRTSHDFWAIFDGITRDLAGGSKMDQLISATRLLTALMVLLRDVMAKTGEVADIESPGRKRKLLNEAKRYVESNFNRTISLDEIAEVLNVSAYYLSHIFSEGYGLPLFEYVLDIRMEKAAELLAQGDLNVAQVAGAVGYENSNYFSRTFKKYFGVIPSKWPNKATE